MIRTTRRPVVGFLAGLLGCAVASCIPAGPTTTFMTYVPEQQPQPPRPAPSLSIPQPAPAADPSGPGGRVLWTDAPALRPAPRTSAFLADVESRLPPEMGTRYRDRDHVTWCHETTHGVHAALRNRYGLPAFYPGGGRCALVEAPALTLGEVAAVVPQRFRGTRYNTYLVSQRRDWDRDPLYVWDEWVAYDNGASTAVEEGVRPGAGMSDDAVACLELSTYALGVAAAARRKGVQVSGQFREFLAWELRRSADLYARALALPAFAWPDRRLERLWRAGDPFVTEELRALYGDSLTAKALLP
jgi:hypothetical protein